MRSHLLRGVGVLAVLTSAVMAAGPMPTTGPAATQPVPASQPADSAAASAFIDDFLAGRDDAILAKSGPKLKAALAQTSLADVRNASVGANSKPLGVDRGYTTVTRRVVGSDGKTYEIVASVADGHLAGFFVRPSE